MPETYATRFFLSPALSLRQRAAAEARITAAGATIDRRLTRGTDFVVDTAAGCSAARRSVAASRTRATHITVAGLRRRLAGEMVIALEDGDEHVLNLGTGTLHKRFPVAVAAMLPLAEDEVTKPRLEEILAAAGIRTTRESDGDLVAHAFGEAVHVMIAEDRQFVRFLKLVKVDALVGEESRGIAVTRLNREFDVVRFRLWNDTGICGDYAMSFTYGILPSQIVGMLVGFSWVVKTALHSDIAAELLGGQG